jgi:hypothetical protein
MRHAQAHPPPIPERKTAGTSIFARVHVGGNGQLAIAFRNARLIYLNVEGD